MTTATPSKGSSTPKGTGSGTGKGSTRDWSATAGPAGTSAGAAASARRSGTTRTPAGRAAAARSGGKVSAARAKAGTAAAVAAAAARAADGTTTGSTRTAAGQAGGKTGKTGMTGAERRSGSNRPEPASKALVVAERPGLPVVAGTEVTRSPSTSSSSAPDLDSTAVETITVGEARSRFRSPDGRRLLVTPRLRPIEGEPARPPADDADGSGAPFVAPTNPVAKAVARRRWERKGFVPVTPGRVKVRHRILPRSVIGIATMLLFFGLGVGFSGAAFYAYYDQRLAQNEETVSRFVNGFDKQFTDAVGAVDDLRVQAVEDIRAEMVPIEGIVADANGVSTLPASVGPSVWQVETKDEAGNLLTGAAFAVLPHDGGTAFVTSYSLIAASTTEPAPAIELVKRTQRIPAQLWAWDPDRDLALVVVKEVIPPLSLASDVDQVTAVGGRVFAMSGVGGQGSTASPGTLLDHSQSGLQHTAAVGTLFQGGPLVSGDGRVIGMASLGYRPNGIDPGDVRQAPDVAALCARILHCAKAAEVMTVDLNTEAPIAGTPVNPGTGDPAATPAGD